VRAIILVGGEGTRLRPLTLRTPKQVVPVLNRPLLDHLLLHLKDHGITSMTLAMTRRSEAVREAFGDGGHLGVQLDYAYEETPLGSGGAIASIASGWDEPFLVCNGDIITDLDVSAFVRTHYERRAELSIALHEVEDPSAFGVVVLDGASRITQFVEKPPREEAPSTLINAGFWIFQPSLLAEMAPTQFNRVEDGLFPGMAASGRDIFGYHRQGYWRDIGNPEAYHLVNLELLGGAYPARLPARWPPERVETHGATVDEAARVSGPALVGRGTRVAEAASLLGPVVLGANCAVGVGAEVSGSVLWDDVTVESGARVTASVVASGARIGSGAHVEGAVIGHGATIPPRTHVPPGTRVDPDSVYAAAATMEQ
jgi:mannose-1-phosphate guanylyltransferase